MPARAVEDPGYRRFTWKSLARITARQYFRRGSGRNVADRRGVAIVTSYEFKNFLGTDLLKPLSLHSLSLHSIETHRGCSK